MGIIMTLYVLIELGKINENKSYDDSSSSDSACNESCSENLPEIKSFEDSEDSDDSIGHKNEFEDCHIDEKIGKLILDF